MYSIDSVDVLMKQVQTMSSSPFGALKLVQTKRDHKKFMTIDYVLSLTHSTVYQTVLISYDTWFITFFPSQSVSPPQTHTNAKHCVCMWIFIWSDFEDFGIETDLHLHLLFATQHIKQCQIDRPDKMYRGVIPLYTHTWNRETALRRQAMIRLSKSRTELENDLVCVWTFSFLIAHIHIW